MNASSPIDLQQYIGDKTFDVVVTWNVFYLYISLAVSITVAAFALIISVWLIRYQRSLSGVGLTIHERIRQRHESFVGLMEWRLPIMIEILPIVALMALALFAQFIRLSIWKAYPAVGITLLNIFVMVAIFFVMTASFAAFIPGAPFHSPLSGFIRFAFQIFPNRSIRGLIRIRTVCVTLISVVSLVENALPYSINRLSLIDLILEFLVYVSVLSLCQRTQGEKKVQEQSKPALFNLATWVYSSCIVLTALSFTINSMPSFTLFLVFSVLRAITILIASVGAIKIMSRWTPDEGKAKVDAVAWMIETHPHSVTFQNAIEIAQNFAHLRSTLLESILPVLDVLIKCIQGSREQDLNDEEKMYITLLCILVDFEPSEASFWRNEAAVKRPVLSDELKEKLQNMRKGGCIGHSAPLVSGCTKAEAEFILRKVGEEDSMVVMEGVSCGPVQDGC